MKKTISILLIGIMLLQFFVPLNQVYASSENNPNQKKYSQTYLEYLKLSDEEKEKLTVIPRKYEVPLDEIYENAEVVKEKPSISNLFGLFAKTELKASNSEKIPAKFNLADVINIKVENQGQEGNCWAFASLETLETYLALHENKELDFSEKHLAYLESAEFSNTYGYTKLFHGGTYEFFYDYVSQKLGPVLETEIPYNANIQRENYNYLLSRTPKAYVKNIKYFPNIDPYKKSHGMYSDETLNLFRSNIKKHIMENGALYCSIVAPQYYRDYFNPDTGAAYVPENDVKFWEHPHAVAIIGWDDNYSKNNFNVAHRPSKDGAYIALNSWGTGFGKNGVFYISYEDAWVEQEFSGIMGAATDEQALENINTGTIEDDNGTTTIQFNDNVRSLGNNQAMMGLALFYTDNSITYNKKDLLGIKSMQFNLNDIEGVQYYKNLESITLRPRTSPNSIEGLEKLKLLNKLKKINLYNANVTTLVSFKELSNMQVEPNDDDGKKYNDQFESYIKNDGQVIEDEVYIDELELSNNPITSGFETLASVPIKTLKLNNCNLDDSVIQYLKNVRPVTINGKPFLRMELKNNNFQDVSELTQVTELDLSGNTNIDLSKIPKVDTLIIGNTLTDFSGLMNLPRKLDVNTTQNIDLTKIPQVEALVLNGCGLSDVENLNNFPIKELCLKGNRLQNLNKIINSNLEILDLSNTRITDVEGFSTMQNLESLDISNCQDVQNYEKLTNIKKLYMRNCGLTSADVFLEMKNIEYLDISQNSIENITYDLPNGLYGQYYIKQIPVVLGEEYRFDELGETFCIAKENLNREIDSWTYGHDETLKLDEVNRDLVVDASKVLNENGAPLGIEFNMSER